MCGTQEFREMNEEPDAVSMSSASDSNSTVSDTSLDITAGIPHNRNINGLQSPTTTSTNRDQIPPPYQESAFVAAAQNILRRGLYGSRRGVQSYVNMFGVSPTVTAVVWVHIRDSLPEETMPKHLLWALMLLKVYGTEAVHEALSGVCRTTFRNWAWTLIKSIADVKTVRLTLQYTNIIERRVNEDTNCCITD